jgi:hypothetical protein
MPEHPENAVVDPETQHEESDVDVRALLWFVAVFIAFAVLMHAALWTLFKFYVQAEVKAAAAPMTQIAVSPDASVPGLPRLQPFPAKGPGGETQSPVDVTPAADLVDMRAREDAILDHYGWVDHEKGIVHIPIEQAKQLVLQRGFPVATAETSPAAAVPATSTGTQK